MNLRKKLLQFCNMYGNILPLTICKEVKVMKDGIHPEYKECTVKCACGATYGTKSTKGDMKVDICSKCHPFFTGKQKLVDTGGRVDRFNKRYGIKD